MAGSGPRHRYQRGRRDDTLSALIEALYWGRDDADAWSDLWTWRRLRRTFDVARLVCAGAVDPGRCAVQLLSISEQRDRLRRLTLPKASDSVRDCGS